MCPLGLFPLVKEDLRGLRALMSQRLRNWLPSLKERLGSERCSSVWSLTSTKSLGEGLCGRGIRREVDPVTLAGQLGPLLVSERVHKLVDGDLRDFIERGLAALTWVSTSVETLSTNARAALVWSCATRLRLAHSASSACSFSALALSSSSVGSTGEHVQALPSQTLRLQPFDVLTRPSSNTTVTFSGEKLNECAGFCDPYDLVHVPTGYADDSVTGFDGHARTRRADRPDQPRSHR